MFREVTQEPDGTLDTRFPAEMIPETSAPIKADLEAMSNAVKIDPNSIELGNGSGVASARIKNIPQNVRITMQVEPVGANEELGLMLKSNDDANDGYRLNISANNGTVELANTMIQAVNGLQKPFTLDIVIKDGILDADIDHRRTIVNRTYDLKGDVIWLYAKHGKVKFTNIVISPLKEE